MLWVGDDEDWETARQKDQVLVCPETACDIELAAVHAPSNRYNPRFFRFKSASRICGHWPAGNRGGPETPQHDWVKARLARIARHQGYQATAEHWHTRADVYVHEPAFCLEVQLRPTQFADRTASRHHKGTEVCWFIRDGLDSKKSRQALFHGRGVRFRVVDRETHRPIEPWNEPGNYDLDRRAVIEVWGTVARLPRRGREPDPTATGPGVSWFTTGTLSGYQFLTEVLSGQRRWHPAGRIGNKTGLWVLDTDVAAYNEFRKRQQQHREQLARKAEEAGGPQLSGEPQTEPAEPTPHMPVSAIQRHETTREIAELEADTGPINKIGNLPRAAVPVYSSASRPRPRPRRRRWWQFWLLW
ncbi:hypothetical protein OOZ19_04440 [Saccharopolyspora sp. NFXS83]|uniref:hypothetical protein n=1 Tax=Saccharopolyspora sp. NFXS83 TaxID=2993560 RepID=UPI00224B2A81|nr:hypothetical protein [Saccharopolyspora sp. NFXS83]MCX2729476.1 hypothetical protein [Saccharopolyspora sp. NFXS83]